MHTLPSPASCSHRQIRLRKLRNGKLCSDFQIYSHTPDEVAMAIEAYALPPPDHTNDQRQALEDYNQLRSMSDVNMNDPNVLLEYLRVFDRIFFFGALGNHCELKTVEVISETKRVTVRGVTEAYDEMEILVLDCAYKATITISDHSRVNPPPSLEKLVDKYLGTLLHETLHAMFFLYVCKHHDHCIELFLNKVGKRGHKVCWQRAAKVIETASARMGMARGESETGLKLKIENSVQIDSEEAD